MRSHYEWVPRVNKGGRLGALIARWVYYTPLEACDACGMVSTPKRVQYRSHLHRTLCMGCWNQIRVVQYAIDAAKETKTIINRHIKEIENARKQVKNHRAAA